MSLFTAISLVHETRQKIVYLKPARKGIVESTKYSTTSRKIIIFKW